MSLIAEHVDTTIKIFHEIFRIEVAPNLEETLGYLETLNSFMEDSFLKTTLKFSETGSGCVEVVAHENVLYGSGQLQHTETFTLEDIKNTINSPEDVRSFYATHFEEKVVKRKLALWRHSLGEGGIDYTRHYDGDFTSIEASVWDFKGKVK